MTIGRATTRWLEPAFNASAGVITRFWSPLSAPAGRMPGVTIAENVPDARLYFERAGVMVYAPGCGSGMKVKVMEAFALGVPVVTTAEGVEGLPARDGIHAGVCEDEAGLADRAVRLLTDRDTAERQRTAARALLEQHCGPGPTLDALERVYGRITGGTPA